MNPKSKWSSALLAVDYCHKNSLCVAGALVRECSTSSSELVRESTVIIRWFKVYQNKFVEFWNGLQHVLSLKIGEQCEQCTKTIRAPEGRLWSSSRLVLEGFGEDRTWGSNVSLESHEPPTTRITTRMKRTQAINQTNNLLLNRIVACLQHFRNA